MKKLNGKKQAKSVRAVKECLGKIDFAHYSYKVEASLRARENARRGIRARSHHQSVYKRPGYRAMKTFNDKLLDGRTRQGKMLSSKNLRHGSEKIQLAINRTIVNNGHGALVR